MNRIRVGALVAAVLAVSAAPCSGQFAPIMEIRIAPAPGSPKCGTMEVHATICPLYDFARAEAVLECSTNMGFQGATRTAVSGRRGDTTSLTWTASVPCDDTSWLIVTVWGEFAEGVGVGKDCAQNDIKFITTGDALQTVGGGPPLILEGLDDLPPSVEPQHETPKVKSRPREEVLAEWEQHAQWRRDSGRIHFIRPDTADTMGGSTQAPATDPRPDSAWLAAQRALADSLEALKGDAEINACINLTDAAQREYAVGLLGHLGEPEAPGYWHLRIRKSQADSLMAHGIGVTSLDLWPHLHHESDKRRDLKP